MGSNARMNSSALLRACGTILSGRKPLLSIEVTRECPLRCPGCYAYEDTHLGGNGVTLRTLSDFKGDDLVARIMNLVHELRPLHVSLVGGDPLVRYREMEQVIALLTSEGIHVQLVTSAFRPLPAAWATTERLNVVVSIDGLQPEHDWRRKPATYERVLKNIAGQQITVHCTISAQIARPNYLETFTRFWSARPEVRRIWFSLFTPQRGATDDEILPPDTRFTVVKALLDLRQRFPKIDMPAALIEHFVRSIRGPEECLFAQMTEVVSADLKTRVTPCQFGGDPDCSQCGCMASMGLAAVGEYRIGNVIPIRAIYRASTAVASAVTKPRKAA
jgi:MoaA/NifB/PqqE/SkfB family radical SAM enzyme